VLLWTYRKIKEDEMGRTCSTYREKRNIYRISVKKPGGKRAVGRYRSGWKIILKWVLEKLDAVEGTGFIWLRMGTSEGLL
jgi:hypothetical protein